ncbi:MAG: class I SAM-dependent methyltransferase [Spirochaetota bacterium]
MAKTHPFDTHGEEYDRWFDDHEQLYEAELQAVGLLIPEGAEGLEIGVGSGKFAAPLGVQTGLEPSTAMAEKARKRGIKVYTGVAEDLPFPSQQFDYVLMVTTICFVDDIDMAFREANRVLRQNGAIILGFVDRESEIGRSYLARKKTSLFYQDATFYSTEEVLTHLQSTGFEISKIIQTLLPGTHMQEIREGYGTGSFVVIQGVKTSQL